MIKKIPDKFIIRIDARNKYHLSDAQIQMARELGMNPKKFGKPSNDKQELWKTSLPKFTDPDKVISIENKLEETNHKKENKRAAKINIIKNGANTALHGTEPCLAMVFPGGAIREITSSARSGALFYANCTLLYL